MALGERDIFLLYTKPEPVLGFGLPLAAKIRSLQVPVSFTVETAAFKGGVKVFEKAVIRIAAPLWRSPKPFARLVNGHGSRDEPIPCFSQSLKMVRMTGLEPVTWSL